MSDLENDGVDASEVEPKPENGDDDLDEERTQTPPAYNPPISALPPRVIAQEESQVEVSASPAFQCLDDVSYLYIFIFFIY